MFYVCIAILGDTSNDNVQWEIILPEQIVPDTAAGKIIINSDILGPMFQVSYRIFVI